MFWNQKNLNEYLAEFQKYIGDIGYDIINQKYCLLTGMQWELNILLVQHDTDQLTFDKMVKLFISLISKIWLANQNRLKNYNITPFPNNIYVFPFLLTTTNHVPAQHQITTIYISFAQHQPDQNDFINFSATNKGLKKTFTAEKKNTVSKTICVYIMANRVTEISTINFSPHHNESTSYPKLLHIIYHHQPSSRSKFPHRPIKKNLIFASSLLQKPSRFFIFVLIWTPANSVEISNKNLGSRCIIKIEGKSENRTILLDTGVIGENSMDK